MPTYFQNMTLSGAGIAKGTAMDGVGSHQHGNWGEHTHGDPSFSDSEVIALESRGCHVDRFHGLVYSAQGGLLPPLLVGNMLQAARREDALEPRSPEAGDGAVAKSVSEPNENAPIVQHLDLRREP
jgi:hypothetical protein